MFPARNLPLVWARRPLISIRILPQIYAELALGKCPLEDVTPFDDTEVRQGFRPDL
jgi:hypothetical protein